MCLQNDAIFDGGNRILRDIPGASLGCSKTRSGFQSKQPGQNRVPGRYIPVSQGNDHEHIKSDFCSFLELLMNQNFAHRIHGTGIPIPWIIWELNTWNPWAGIFTLL